MIVSPTSVFVALPVYGYQVFSPCVMSLMGLVQAFGNKGIGSAYGTLSMPDIAELRNVFLTIWFDRIKSTHILLVDADMEFDPQMVMDMLAFDKPLVGCVYPKKRLPIEFVGKPFDPVGQPSNGFLKVDGIGFGVTLIRRDCVESLLSADPGLSDGRLERHVGRDLLAQYQVDRIIRAFDPIDDATGRLSEDLSFCRRYREAGGDVWASIGYPIGHMGMYVYRGQFSPEILCA